MDILAQHIIDTSNSFVEEHENEEKIIIKINKDIYDDEVHQDMVVRLYMSELPSPSNETTMMFATVVGILIAGRLGNNAVVYLNDWMHIIQEISEFVFHNLHSGRVLSADVVKTRIEQLRP